jgi:hypothetical protein
MRTAWALAEAWYEAPRNDKQWRRYTPEEIASLFARLGLTGDFWRV